MRIGTWNVEYVFKERLDVLRRVLALRDNHADIWVLTETHDEFVPPGMEFVVHAEPRPKNYWAIRPGSRWVSIWSRYPIVEQVTLPGADLKRTTCAIFDIGEGRTLAVYGTVMPWHSDQSEHPPASPLPNWSEHHRVLPIQCAEWRMLREKYPDASLCVAGDYNTDMGTGARYGTKRGIASVRAGLDASDLFCATEPGRVPDRLLPVLPIDHISLPRAWETSTKVVSAWPAFKGVISDHSGLVVEVTL
jgi:hypothetical protein